MCDINGCGLAQTLPPIKVSETDRRAFLAGALSLPLATVLAYPELAKAQADNLQDITIPTSSGGTASGVIAMPSTLPAPTVLLVHEWWGLNDQIKAVTAEFAALGYIALAVDLYGGKVVSTGEEARDLMGKIDAKQATEHLAATVNHLRKMEGSNGKVGTVGWCFGGGWSLNASIAAPVDATVIYYGNVVKPAFKLAKLSGPVLGHFATKDGWINREMVGDFTDNMAEADKFDALTVHWYKAGHAFANPTGARYDETNAALAWERTQAFFAANLKG